MLKTIVAIVALTFVGVPVTHAQSAADSSAMLATALDYIEGWYLGGRCKNGAGSSSGPG